MRLILRLINIDRLLLKPEHKDKSADELRKEVAKEQHMLQSLGVIKL